MLRFLDTRKERFTPLAAGNRFTSASGFMLKFILGTTPPAREIVPSSRRIFRLYRLGLIGLAAAIVFWGAASRLSYYHRHPTHEQRASVLRLWIEIRHHLSSIAPRHGTRFATVTSQAIFCSTQPYSGVDCCAVPVARTLTRSVPLSASLIPFRSPPFHAFLPA